MATVAIGDIHGNLPALVDLLAQVNDGIGANDTVVFLGDYIDRGPDSRACIDAILEFQKDSRAKVVCLQGNHEDWLLRTQANYAKHSWLLGMEALDTIRSYSREAERILRDAIGEAGPTLFEGRGAARAAAGEDRGGVRRRLRLCPGRSEHKRSANINPRCRPDRFKLRTEDHRRNGPGSAVHRSLSLTLHCVRDTKSGWIYDPFRK